MEDYKKKYENALELIKDCVPDENGLVHVRPCEIFPELKEDEDEKIRKEIIRIVDGYFPDKASTQRGKYITWLEKQKPTTWSDKDIKMIDSIINEVTPLGECPDYPTDEDREYYYKGQDRVDWLERLKNKRNRYDFVNIRKSEVLDKIRELGRKTISQSDFVIELENWLKNK